MAKRLNPRHQDMVRTKIQASQIINRLQSLVDGDIDMTQAQVSAAKILLDKAISNAPTVLAGDSDNPLSIAWALPKPSREQ